MGIIDDPQPARIRRVESHMLKMYHLFAVAADGDGRICPIFAGLARLPIDG
jgi:hypothetical protein